MPASPDSRAERSTAALSWRIPTSDDSGWLRFSLAQIGLAGVVCALIFLVTLPAVWLGPALIGLVVVSVILLASRWHRHQRAHSGPDNVWLDPDGLHWVDAGGQQQTFARGTVRGFRIGHEADTLRSLPALTLVLEAGFESQPIELHPPASEEAVRQFLKEQWQLPESQAVERSAATLDYDQAVDVYSECHEEYQEWHLEGTRAALGELFDAIAQMASEPLAPTGAKFVRRVLLARRRTPSRLVIEHGSPGYVGDDTIRGSSNMLFELSAAAARTLGENKAAECDLKFNHILGRGNQWTFHLHVRES